MNALDPLVEHRLSQAADRRKAIEFVRRTARLGLLVAAALLLTGLANVYAGLPAVFVRTGMFFGVVGGGVGVVLLGLTAATSRQERDLLARAWEKAYSPLLDRLNTLVYLEGQAKNRTSRSFARRIESQAHDVLAADALPVPFDSTRAAVHALACFLLVLPTVVFYQTYRPWVDPPPEPPVVVEAPAAPEPALELPPPKSVQEDAPWGEVRITRPGADLAVTPAEDVPVQIEAASNRPLESVEWFTAVNDGPEQAHRLPDPDEPLFAAYRETIRPREMKLADWDVVTYYARAAAKGGATYQSDVYFVEVRPFRNDTLEQTGGEDSPLYELLDELTGLIDRQQDVIRKTHRARATKDGRTSVSEAEGTELAETEDGLAKATEHLAARFEAALKGQGVDEPSARLAEAKPALEQAADKLRGGRLDEAGSRERDALAKMVAARKRFQQALSQNPDALKTLRDEKITRQTAPADMLKKIAEFRDEAAAAQEFVRKATAEQRDLARASRPLKTPNPALARRQDALRESLEEFRKQHPKPFEGAGKPCEAASLSMRSAAVAMRQPGKASQAGPRAGDAAAKLQALGDAMKDPAHDRQLADAYRLKRELDAQVEEFAALEKNPQSLAPEDVKKAADRAKDLARQLKQTAEKAPTRDDFGPELRGALDDKALSDFESQCDGLGKAGGGGARAQAAGRVKEGLQKMARAFEKSAPQAVAGGGKKGPGPLKPEGQEALDRGLSQLEGLAEGDEADGEGKGRKGEARQGAAPQGAKLSALMEAKLRAEAAANLTAGVYGRFGHNDRSAAFVRLVEKEVRDRPEPIDAAVIARLRQALEDRQVEVAGAADTSDSDRVKAARIDPARLPPAYRKAIEAYYQKLSERP